MKKVHLYDPLRDKWTAPAMTEQRKNFAAVVVGDDVYIFGGGIDADNYKATASALVYRRE